MPSTEKNASYIRKIAGSLKNAHSVKFHPCISEAYVIGPMSIISTFSLLRVFGHVFMERPFGSLCHHFNILTFTRVRKCIRCKNIDTV